MLRFFFLIFLLSFLCISCFRTEENEKRLVPMSTKKGLYRVTFYNVENLFDTKDNPNTLDDAYTPSGSLRWNKSRYQKKLENIARVIAKLHDTIPPSIIGLGEVENIRVLEDLVRQKTLSHMDLGILHKDSPDQRGIDVALLYNKKLVHVLDKAFIKVKLPSDRYFKTRDVLCAKVQMGEQIVHVLVNHWPSRREGRHKTEPRRVAVAKQIKDKIRSIFAKESRPNIVIMGDFNDEPINKSIKDILGAHPHIDETKGNYLYNLMGVLYRNGKGASMYKGEWDMLDQLIVSGRMLEPKATCKVKNNRAYIYSSPDIMFKHPKNGYMPNRTFGGRKYFGGFSDHLPVYFDVYLP